MSTSRIRIAPTRDRSEAVLRLEWPEGAPAPVAGNAIQFALTPESALKMAAHLTDLARQMKGQVTITSHSSR